ncbi:type II secretion system protein N [Sphingosinicella terrae]|uniref:type II secretion system protein N n=1 Tax=Sphingosinicella terrae TaxID=2172047 RepID=UPI000E0DB16D|nr:type II secretion system protein N [Sphingosinicella terrae]
MKRVRLPVARGVFVASAFLFALIALLPLRLALDWMDLGQRGLSARAASGSLWFGALQEAGIGPVALGDVSARFHLLPLFLGRARLTLESEDEANGIRGAIVASRHGFAFDSVDGTLRDAFFPPLPFGRIELEDFSAGFANGQCVQAGGSVRVFAGGDLATLGLAAELGGTPRCEGAALLLPLAGRSGRLDVRLFADGRYRLDLRVAADPAMGQQLVAAGLRPVPGGFGMRLDGSF